MARTVSHFSRIAVLLIAIAAVAAVATINAAGKQKSKPQFASPQNTTSYRPTDPSLYAGNDVCAACHDAETKSYNRGPHWKTVLE